MNPAQRLQIGYEYCNSLWKRHEVGITIFLNPVVGEEELVKRKQDVKELMKGLQSDLINFGFQVHADSLSIIQEAWAKGDQERFNNVCETYAIAKAIIQDLTKVLIDTALEYVQHPDNDTSFFEAYHKAFLQYKSSVQSELVAASVGAGMGKEAANSSRIKPH